MGQAKTTYVASKPPAGGLDAQYAELIETVWACERTAKREARMDALLRVADSVRP